MVKNLPETWEAWVWSLAWEDALEKAGMKYFSSPIEDRKCISEIVLSFYFLGICLKVIVSYLIVNLIVTFKREGISSVRFSSVPQSCPTGCNPIYCSMPGLPVHHQLPEFTQAHDHWISDAIQPYHPLLSPSPLPINLSFQMRVFSNESALCIKWPKYWSFSFNISPSNEYSGLISFRIDMLDLLAVQGTLKSLLQHHSSKASVLWCSAVFTVQLSHPYMTTGKNIALTRGPL